MATTPAVSQGRGSNRGRNRERVGAQLARLYDLDVASERADLDMYLALASASDGPVLELACGSGRISVPLAMAGQHVTGVDNDPHMLARAGAAWAGQGPGRLDLVEADLTTLRLDARFDVVILGFHSLLLLATATAQHKSLEVVRDHLARDGRAVIDVWLPTAEDLAEYNGHEVTDWTRVDPETGEQVTKRWRSTYEPASSLASVETTFTVDASPSQKPRSYRRRDEIRFIAPEELLATLERAGLRPQQVCGGYDMHDFEPGDERMIVIAAQAPSDAPDARRPA